jgi:hypothetical protein
MEGSPYVAEPCFKLTPMSLPLGHQLGNYWKSCSKKFLIVQELSLVLKNCLWGGDPRIPQCPGLPGLLVTFTILPT